MLTFQSPDVLKFFGKRITKAGKVPNRVQAEVTFSLKARQPGTRTKHWYGSNSLKAYDKAYAEVGCMLRVEMTMQGPEPFKAFRGPEGAPERPAPSVDYSSRKATIGSTREALRAGARQAVSETINKRPPTAVNVRESRGWISKSRLPRTRLST
jgi:hypothetical protein